MIFKVFGQLEFFKFFNNDNEEEESSSASFRRFCCESIIIRENFSNNLVDILPNIKYLGMSTSKVCIFALLLIKILDNDSKIKLIEFGIKDSPQPERIETQTSIESKTSSVFKRL